MKWNRMRSCKYGSMLRTGESRWIRFRGLVLLLQLFCRFEFFQIQIWGWEIRMQENQKVSKKQIGKKNLRAFVLIVNLSSCHSDCHRAVASMLVNAEKLYSTWQDGRHLLGSEYCVLSGYHKFVLRIPHFLSIHMSLIWAKGQWVFHSKKLKRKFEYLLQSIWWPHLIIFNYAFLKKVAQKHQQNWMTEIVNSLQLPTRKL